MRAIQAERACNKGWAGVRLLLGESRFGLGRIFVKHPRHFHKDIHVI